MDKLKTFDVSRDAIFRSTYVQYMYPWAGLSIRGVRSFEHVLIVTKWLRTMNLAIKRRRKSLVTTGEAVIKQL